MAHQQSSAFIEASKREVLRIHKYFVNWINGRVSRDSFGDEAEAAWDSNLTLIKVSGELVLRAQLTDEIIDLYGTYKDKSPQFSMSVRSLEVLHANDNFCLLAYEEIHGLDQSTRQCSALFLKNPEAPEGVAWAHIHETLLEGNR